MCYIQTGQSFLSFAVTHHTLLAMVHSWIGVLSVNPATIFIFPYRDEIVRVGGDHGFSTYCVLQCNPAIG